MAGLGVLLVVRVASICSGWTDYERVAYQLHRTASGDRCFYFYFCLWVRLESDFGGAVRLEIGITHEAIFDFCCWTWDDAEMGGGLFWEGGLVTVIDGSFSGCFVYGEGGGIASSSEYSGNLQIDGCTFNQNDANEGAAATYSDGADGFENVHEYNYANFSGNGGGNSRPVTDMRAYNSNRIKNCIFGRNGRLGTAPSSGIRHDTVWALVVHARAGGDRLLRWHGGV
jgi:hypothetical protein